MTAIRKPRDPNAPTVAPGVPVTPADVEAKLRRAGELKLDVELEATKIEEGAKTTRTAFRAALDALHGMLVDEIRRMQ